VGNVAVRSYRSMGLQKREVCILALKATIPSKGFLRLKASTLITVDCIIVYNTEHIFILDRLKINHVKEL
jgi:hypothetical protein